jgi:hypothetical protein
MAKKYNVTWTKDGGCEYTEIFPSEATSIDKIPEQFRLAKKAPVVVQVRPVEELE